MPAVSPRRSKSTIEKGRHAFASQHGKATSASSGWNSLMRPIQELIECSEMLTLGPVFMQK